jgi:hypothetical protein
MQFETGSTATNYQRVTTQYDVTEAGVQSLSYLFFDGGSDFMSTSTITPGTDKAQVFAGVRKLSDAVQGMLVELSASVSLNNGTFFIVAPYTVAGPNYRFGSKGTLFTTAETPEYYAAPTSNVLTAIGDISGDSAILRIDGAQEDQSTADQGSGNFLAYPLYIGRRNATTNLYFSGHLYSLITRFGPNLDATTIASTEAYVAGKTGFYTPIITGVPTIGVS